jgi:hypothetical protein
MRPHCKGYHGKECCSLRSRCEPGYAFPNEVFSRGVPERGAIEAPLRDLINAEEVSVLDWVGETGKNTPFSGKVLTVHDYEESGIKSAVPNVVNASRQRGFLPVYVLVILSNVLGRIPCPAQEIKSVVRYMSRLSILFVEVPCEAIRFNAFAQESPRQLSQRLHRHERINCFSRDSLASSLEASSLEIQGSSLQAMILVNTRVSSRLANPFCLQTEAAQSPLTV